MTKQQIKRLVKASYNNDLLDEKLVNKISNMLKRNELKQYIRTLKQSIKQNTLYIEVPFNKELIDINKMKEIFDKKNINVKVNPELLVGIRIADNDDIIAINMYDQLNSIMAGIIKN